MGFTPGFDVILLALSGWKERALGDGTEVSTGAVLRARVGEGRPGGLEE